MSKVKKYLLSVLYSIKHRLSMLKLWLGKKLGVLESEMLGVEMMLVSDTIEAALHTASKGWIMKDDIAHIAKEKKEDGAPNFVRDFSAPQ